ncbi:MAG: AMP-binding protein, partial [Pyrinomonadaceae bacterium]
MSATNVLYERGSEELLSAPSTVVELLRRRAASHAEKVAYTFLVDGEAEEVTLTYGELDRRARAVAGLLQSLGAQGERALLLYPSGLNYLTAFFGCLYAGVIAVPAYPPRANRTLDRLESIVADSQPTFALTTDLILSKAEPFFGKVPLLETLRWLVPDSHTEAPQETWREPELDGDTLAFLQYTSGSTSAPKGVMVSHGNLLHNEKMIQEAFRQTERSVIVGWLPLYHDMGLIGNVIQPLYLGAQAILMSPASFLQRPLRWLQAISRYKGTTSGGPNFAYELCASRIAPAERELLDLSHWEVAYNGSEPVRAETLDRFARAFEGCGFRREAFYPCYGLAEATLFVSGGSPSELPVVKRVQKKSLMEDGLATDAASDDEGCVTLVSSGRVSAEQQVRVVHPESLTECAPGAVGEIWIAGASVSRGYWNREEESEYSFRALLPEGGKRTFLRTGDLGFVQSGELFVTGRLKDLIIIRGLNHYPQDIELTVERSHESLRPGCGAAFSVEVEGDERLVIVHELEHRQQSGADEIFEAVRQAVAEGHELNVHAIALVRAGSIPKASSGKIQRRACRAGYVEGTLNVLAEWRAGQMSEAGESPSPDAKTIPQSVEAIQMWLALQLASRLGLDAFKIDINQPFARFGIDSLASVELLHAIDSGLGLKLPASSLLQSSSIAHLARQIVEQLAEPAPSSPPIATTDADANQSSLPLSYGQRALWFLHQVAPESAAYNVARAVRINSPLDVEALRRAFQSLVNRHASLRATFPSERGQPVQRIHDDVTVSFREVDAADWDESALDESLLMEVHTPFDLERGPLMRVSLYRSSAREHVLLLTLHHAVVDFWSMAILMHELGVLYRSGDDGSSGLAPLKLQYGDYARWQAETLAGPEGERLWAYWQKQLAGELPALDLPTDRERPSVQTYKGSVEPFKLDPVLTQRLKALSQKHGATLNATMLAAFHAFLQRYSGQPDISVGSFMAGRGQKELAELVGYFVNPIVIRADLAGNPSFEKFLAQVRDTYLAAIDHQDYPFALLVERLQPERDPSRSPLFQAAFVFQKTHLLEDEGVAAFAIGEAGARMNLGGLELESAPLPQHVTQFDLTLMLAEVNGGLSGSFHYNTDLFEAATITRMSGHFQNLLKGITANPALPLAELPLLAEAERRQTLIEWNDTGLSIADGRCVHELFEAQAALTPDLLALAFDQDQLSYSELNARSNRLAHLLRARGVAAESVVAVLMERSVELVVSLLAVLKAGAAYLPLDLEYPRERLAFMLEDAGVAVVLTRQSLQEVLPEGVEHVIRLDADAGEIDASPAHDLRSDATPENLAYVIYTSGSTGRPKGVEVTHLSLRNLVAWHQHAFSVSDSDRATQLASPAFDAAVWELWPYLTAGASVHIV